jgi:glutamate dehydrogenase (NADP+)
VLTGKGPAWGGSILRPEATGFGASYFCHEMLKARSEDIKGKIVCISGSGNVAQYAVEKMTELGATVVTVSDSNGYVYDPDGIDKKKLEVILDLKNVKRGRIKEYADKFNVEYFPDKRPWEVKCDIAMPCATENEIDGNDAQKLVDNGVIAVVEGANMPSTLDATKIFLEGGVSFAPGKAANAGGVATSGLEMTQNAIRLSWGREEVDKQLHTIMANIHQSCYDAAKKYGGKGSSKIANYVLGANTAGFLKVAAAMIEQGLL